MQQTNNGSMSTCFLRHPTAQPADGNIFTSPYRTKFLGMSGIQLTLFKFWSVFLEKYGS